MTSKKKRKKKKGPSPQKGITNERLADKLNLPESWMNHYLIS